MRRERQRVDHLEGQYLAQERTMMVFYRESEDRPWIHCMFGGRLRLLEGNDLTKATDPVKSWSRIVARYFSSLNLCSL